MIICFSEQPSGRSYVVNLREKFSPGTGFEPGSPALSAGAQTNCANQTNSWAKLELFAY